MALAARRMGARISSWLIDRCRRLPKKALAIFALALFASGCNPMGHTADPAPATDPNAFLSFTMRNTEIRQDILTALTNQGIEHWLNEDGSVGFYAKDTDAVDRIGFSAIGEYAARN